MDKQEGAFGFGLKSLLKLISRTGVSSYVAAGTALAFRLETVRRSLLCTVVNCDELPR